MKEGVEQEAAELGSMAEWRGGPLHGVGAQEDEQDREEDEPSVGHGVGKVPKAGCVGDRSVYRVPERLELKGQETRLQALQPDLQGRMGREIGGQPHPTQMRTGCLELGVSNSFFKLPNLISQ